MRKRIGAAIVVCAVVGCSNPSEPKPYVQAIPGVDFTIEMVPVPSTKKFTNATAVALQVLECCSTANANVIT